MREKMAKMKASKKDHDIDSDGADGDDAYADSDEEQQRRGKLRKDGAITADLVDDPFFAGQELDENETAEEKRLRMTKKLIKQLDEEQKDTEKDDFFMNL